MNSMDFNSQLPPFDLLIEVAPGEGCFAHIPTLPGLCFQADDPEEAKRIAPGQILNYAQWVLAENLANLNPEVEALVREARSGKSTNFQIIEKERKAGSPVWISGNPAALFEHDCNPLDNQAVGAHLRFARQVVKSMRVLVSVLSPAQREHQPAAQVRAVDETLTHIGNCVWWYCARIDDELPEPDDRANEAPMDRIERLLAAAEKYLPAVPNQERASIHIPTRYLTNDAQEAWTHTKVCRRQAEHLWEHLQTFGQEVNIAGKVIQVSSTK